MNNCFDFIIFLAFETAFLYENKKALDLKTLREYRIKLCEFYRSAMKKNYSGFSDRDYENDFNAFLEFNFSLSIADEIYYLKGFLQKNRDFFTFKNGIIYLNEDISFEELSEKKISIEYDKQNFKSICLELIGMMDNLECLSILGVSKVLDVVKQIIQEEKILEGAYYSSEGSEHDNFIKKLRSIIDTKISFLCNLKDRKFNCYWRLVIFLGSQEYEISEDSEIEVLSEKLIDNDSFYNLYLSHIENLFNNDRFLKAIFDNGSLSYQNLCQKFTAYSTYKRVKNRKDDGKIEFELLNQEAFFEHLAKKQEEIENFSDEFGIGKSDALDIDSEEEYDINDLDYFKKIKLINEAFYLTYIRIMLSYEEKYGSDSSTEKIIKRLIYSLDFCGYNLYKSENLAISLNNISIPDISLLSDFYIISRLFLKDLLEGWIDDENNLRKIIFIATYYSLTKDRRIIKIISKYQKERTYNAIFRAIINFDFSEFNKKQFIRELKKDENKNK